MAVAPSWIKQFDHPRSQSNQAPGPEYWHLANNNLYQPLKWHPAYQGQNGSGGNDDNRPPQTKQSRHSVPSLHPIPEDGFLDGSLTSGGRDNSSFELQEYNDVVSANRRFSESDVLSGRYQRKQKNLENGNHRKGRSPGKRKSGDYSNNDDKSERSDGRSEASVRSGRSVRSDSTKSEDTHLVSLTSGKSSEGDGQSSKRGSDASRRKSFDMARGRSASVVSRTMQSDSAAAFARIEIPMELLESPTKRLKRMLGPVIMCILMVTLAASLGAAIYFATVLKDTQQQTIEELVRANLELRIRSAAQTEDLSTMSYQKLRSLGDGYCKQMDKFYKESELFRKTYRSCKVLSIENGKINFTLSFDYQEIAEKDILRVIEEKAKKVKGTTARLAVVDKLKIDLDSARVTMKKVKSNQTDRRRDTVPERVVAPRTSKYVSTTPTTRSTTTTTAGATSEEVKVGATSATTTENPHTIRVSDVDLIDGIKREKSCIGNHGGYLAHPTECNLFYRCQEGKKILFACASDLVFDINKKVCVHRANYDHCPEGVTHSADASGFDWGPHDPWDPCKTNPESLYFPHPRECNLFFHCDHNMSIIRVCQTGLLYDWKNKICVPKSNNVICPDPTQITPTDTDSQNKSKRIVYPARPVYDTRPCKNVTSPDVFPHPQNCSWYYKCDSGGNQETLRCPMGMLYDPAIKACTRVTNHMCPDVRPCLGKSGVYFPHPSQCNMYIFCDGGKEIVQKCAVSMAWDPIVDTCVMRTETSVCPQEGR